MEHYSYLSETLARVTSAWSLPSLWVGVKDFTQRFGYTHIAVADAAKLAGGAREAVFYTDAPQVTAAMDRESVYLQNPMVQRALASSVPFLISELRATAGAGRWSELLADVVKKGDGLVVPVYRGNEPVAGFNFGGEHPDTSALARSMLQVVAHAAVERAFDLRRGNAATPLLSLSVRESQCLRHVATGHPDAEIGRLLGISPRTVRFHVDSAKTKLGVSSRVQAVAKALRERIIAV